MPVQVRLSTLLRQAVNWREFLEIEAETPQECLDELEKLYPEIRKWLYDKHGTPHDHLQCYIDGKLLEDGKWNEPVPGGAELYIILNIGGG